MVSPFQLRPRPVTFASATVDRQLQQLETYVLSDPLGWVDFVLLEPPCFASLWVFSVVIRLLSGMDDRCAEIETRLLGIVKLSMELLATFSFHALNIVSSLWIEIATLLAQSPTQHWIQFAFVGLKQIDEALVLSREKDYLEANSYFFQFLERLLACPFFHMTFCQFDDFIGHHLFPASSPAVYCFLKCLQAMLTKTGYGMAAQTMFACPSWLNVIGIAKFCVGCFDDAHLTAIAHACIDSLGENPFCRAILRSFQPELAAWSRSFRGIAADAKSVLELQLAVNRIVPSRVAKLELALLVLRDEQLKRASAEEIIAFLNETTRRTD
jgi:hypothetical protein